MSFFDRLPQRHQQTSSDLMPEMGAGLTLAVVQKRLCVAADREHMEARIDDDAGGTGPTSASHGDLAPGGFGLRAALRSGHRKAALALSER